MGFFATSAVLGAFLRFLTVHPIAGFNYGHLLHTHSHLAFLGWVFNAFFAIALQWFVPPDTQRAWQRLFIILQIAVLGMLGSYPFQGYGSISIAFSTLHMIAAAVFAWWLWRDHNANAAARLHLLMGLLCMVVSGLGPLALGPLAAMDLRNSPGCTLSIYFYLHAQYNGWFMFFLQATVLQILGQSHDVNIAHARRSAWWFGAGVILTFAQSTLLLNPPVGINVIAAMGGLAQLVGCCYFLRAVWPGIRLLSGPIRLLGGVALFSWLLKYTLQTAAAWPTLNSLVNHRFIAIAFLHLVFLGIVTPALLAIAIHASWLRVKITLNGWLGVFLIGVLVGQLLLIGWPLGLSSLLPNPFRSFSERPSLAR